MNALAGTRVLSEDRLFATLDATTRTVELDSNKEILLSDTVGFIRKLPHRLIESFKSTLDEVREADALVHVVDVTHPSFEDHMEVVDETLAEIEAEDLPSLIVFNKVDALEDAHLIRALKRDYPDASFVSALRGMGLETLKQDLLALIERDYVERVSYVPVTEPKTISAIHRLADVLDEEYVYAHGVPSASGDGYDQAGDRPQAVARLHYRAAPRNAERIEQMVQSFGPLRVVGQNGQPVSGDLLDGDGAATPPDAETVVLKAAPPPSESPSRL